MAEYPDYNNTETFYEKQHENEINVAKVIREVGEVIPQRTPDKDDDAAISEVKELIDKFKAELPTHPEDSANKVKSISSSSTDAKYPSAKAVYDYVQSALILTDTVTSKKYQITITNGTLTPVEITEESDD